MMSDKQAPGGDANPLENNFSAKSGSVQSRTGNSVGPKVSGSSDNFSGPSLDNKKGQQSNG